MTPQLVEFLRHVGQLKALDRRGWKLRSIPKPETVAGHMHRMSIIALATLDPSLTRDLDMNKVIQMCILHDMAECIVGDITPHDNVPEHEKHKQEMAAMQKLCKSLSNSSIFFVSNRYRAPYAFVV